jgi:hypothetical protein
LATKFFPQCSHNAGRTAAFEGIALDGGKIYAFVQKSRSATRLR